ncbi:MAG: AAA family ATPase [Nitrososphaerales archaeon]
MAVITISREFGSVGDDLGQRIAQKLGYHFVDKEFMGALLGRYGLINFEEEFETPERFWERFNAERGQRRVQMVDMLNQVVGGVARHGNVVIQGRSGFAILAGFADVLHVRLQAPFPVRVSYVAAWRRLPPEQAEEVVRQGDKARKSFVEEFYGVAWGDIEAFDLVVNTNKVPPDLAEPWVIEASKALAQHPATAKPTTASIEVDRVLADVITAELGCATEHH